MELSQELLAFNDLRTKEVEVWGKTLTIQEQGLQESMISFGPGKVSEDGTIEVNAIDIAQVIAYGVIDSKTGERVFSDEDVPALAKKNREVLMFLYQEILTLSGDPEEAEKN